MIKKLLLSFSLGATLLAAQEEPLAWDERFPSVQDFHGYLQQAIEEKNWWSAIDYAGIITRHFPSSPFAEDADFIIGESYLGLNEPLIANDYFTSYLNHAESPKHFEEAITYKFQIAERFLNGEKKPLFHSHKAPKWLSAKEDALQIFDEVIATLPHSEIAAKSLLGKAQIQLEMEDFKPSLETLDVLIRRFPKHDLAAEAYLDKIHVYLAQCQGRSLDPDLLDLADVTLRKFRIAFPREPRLVEAEQKFTKMEEIFAQNLLEIGRFFQKTKKYSAAAIYYNKVIAKYPKTPAASLAQDQLSRLS